MLKQKQWLTIMFYDKYEKKVSDKLLIVFID